MKYLTIATRKSQLALLQTELVRSDMQEYLKNEEITIVAQQFNTQGDKILNIPLSQLQQEIAKNASEEEEKARGTGETGGTGGTGGEKRQKMAATAVGEKGIFTAELEEAILQGTCDLAVHSLKDLPTILPEGLALGAISKREDPADAFVAHPSLLSSSSDNSNNVTLASLPKGSVIGTSSLRRAAQIRHLYPHLKIVDVRGNLNTRLKKLDDSDPSPITQASNLKEEDIASGHFAGLVLAVAGLQRLGMGNRITQHLGNILLHAVGQGSLGIECRQNDSHLINNILSKCINDEESSLACRAERAFLRTLEGGCQIPIGVRTTVNLTSQTIILEGGVFSLSGDSALTVKHEGSTADPEAVGRQLAAKVTADPNANALLLSIRTQTPSKK